MQGSVGRTDSRASSSLGREEVLPAREVVEVCLTEISERDISYLLFPSPQPEAQERVERMVPHAPSTAPMTKGFVFIETAH